MTFLQALASIEWHWLRPLWLLGIFPAIMIVWILLRQPLLVSRWANVIDENLLPALLQGHTTRYQPWPVWCLFIGWVIALLALAGPSWEKAESQALKQADAVVILLDLSPSMLAKDVSPTRLQAAQFKILDLLKQRREGYTGLVAYSGSAHVVAPLSDDTNTIAALVPSLEPSIMPKMGSQVEDAITTSLALLENAHFERGRLLLVTDGVVPEAVESIAAALRGKSVTLHVIGVGTAAGGPIPLERGGYIRDEQGKPQLFPFTSETLKTLASNHDGHYSELRIDDADIAPLIALPPWLADLDNSATRETNQTLEHWQDSGYWLLFPLLLVSLVAFRRGLVVGLIPFLLIVTPEHSQALDWNSLWYTPDQQAKQQLDAHDPAAAAELFEDPQWKGYAEYQAGQHDKAAEHFATSATAAAHYNRGNALAKNGQLEDAITSYEEALKQQPDFADAAANRDLVKKILAEQKQQEQQNNDPQQDQDKKDQQDKQSQSEQQQSEQQQQDQQQQDQQQQQADQQNQPSQDSQSAEQQQDPQQAQQQQSDEQQKSDAEQQAQEQQSDEQQKAAEEQQQAEEAKRQQQEEREQARQSEEAKEADAADGAQQETSEEAEKRQATEQWLRKVPDDPGGLLRNKFDYYYQQNQREENRNRRKGIAPDETPRW